MGATHPARRMRSTRPSCTTCRLSSSNCSATSLPTATASWWCWRVDSGIRLLKYYLDISKDEQKARLADRKRDPLKQWKISPIDAVAVKHWGAYTQARDAMLLGSHTAAAPWQVVRTDNKHQARLNLMRDILSRLHYAGRSKKLTAPDRNIVFEFTPDCLATHRLAP
jgi:hypothetical protein